MKRFAVLLFLFSSMSFTGNTVYIQTTAAGGCPDVNLSDTAWWMNFNATPCDGTLNETTYTSHATEEWPQSEVYTASVGATSQTGIYNVTAMKPDNLCSFHQDTTADDATSAGTLTSTSLDNLNNVTDDFTLGLRYKSSTAVEITRVTFQLGLNPTNRIMFWQSSTGNFECSIDPNSGTDLTITTASDTTSTCAACGGSGGCAGKMNDGTARTLECTYDENGASDIFRIYVDGCLSVTDGPRAMFTSPTFAFVSSETIQIGISQNFNSTNMDIGIAALSETFEKDFHNIWSGGDNDMTDGDECWSCYDPSTAGNRCDG